VGPPHLPKVGGRPRARRFRAGPDDGGSTRRHTTPGALSARYA
jgi:hypothetical protein